MNNTRIRLAGTDIELSRLGFGTSTLHRLLTSRSRQLLLGAAFDCGVTHFDSARYYGHGLSEAELGRFVRARRKAVTIGTKIGIKAIAALESWPPLLYFAKAVATLGRPIYPEDPFLRRIDMSVPACITHMDRSVAASLRALGTDYLDLLLLHEPNPHVELCDEVIEWLTGLKRRGVVRALGLAGAAEACVRIASRHPEVSDVLQIADSLDGREADIILSSGRPLQITFGYLRAAKRERRESTGFTEIRELACRIMERNQTGTVLFSSNNVSHVRQLASAVPA